MIPSRCATWRKTHSVVYKCAEIRTRPRAHTHTYRLQRSPAPRVPRVRFESFYTVFFFVGCSCTVLVLSHISECSFPITYATLPDDDICARGEVSGPGRSARCLSSFVGDVCGGGFFVCMDEKKNDYHYYLVTV